MHRWFAAPLRRLGLVLAALALAACTTPYGQKGLFGGYSATQIEPHIFKVSFDGNGNTSEEMVVNFWLYYCAELTLKNGYQYFGVFNGPQISLAPEPEPEYDLAPNEQRGARASNQPAAWRGGDPDAMKVPVKARGGYVYVPIYTPGRTITTWHKNATIVMYRTREGATTPEQRFSLRARTVIDMLKPYVDSGGKNPGPARKEVIDAAMAPAPGERALPPTALAPRALGPAPALPSAPAIPPANTPSPAGLGALAGQWSGWYRCQAYTGPDKVDNPGPWSAPVTMTVEGSRATMVRGDATYRETLYGGVQADLSLVLKGQGALQARSERPWSGQVAGRFAGPGGPSRFDGSAQLMSLGGVTFRHCTVDLVKGAGGQ